MTCREYKDVMMAYLDGELENEEIKQFQAHLKDCPECRQDLEQFTSLKDDNRGICAHAGVCTDRLAAVWRLGEEPWIDPDGAPAEAIIEAVRACPSGALGYSTGGAEAAAPDRGPAITIAKDGPYHVTGGIALADAAQGTAAAREHYTLCRCGESKNKPYCDGSHEQAGFRDTAE